MKNHIVLVISFFITIGTYAKDTNRPNILIILVDDLGYGDLSCTGGTDIRTPNIDKLFDGGMRFTNFYANSTVCSPTRASLLTGRYPDLAGVPGVIRTNENSSWGYLREDLPTLPKMLKKAGYQTAIIGKWHLGLEAPNTPNERGFDFFHGFLGDMMDDYWTHLRHGINYMRLNNGVIEPEGHATDLFSDWAIEYISNVENQEAPFFLYLAYNAPHFPIQPPEEWLSKVEEREQDISKKRAKNVALVEHLDYGIGRVLQALEDKELDKNTIIIFCSDNGGHLPSGASNGDLRGGKQDMYEGGIKVPACFVWKDVFDPGSVCENPGSTMDIFPTLCDITEINITHKIDGISMKASLLNRKQITNDRPIFFMRREGAFYGGLCYYAVRRGKFKLVQNTPFEPLQLFNIFSDPQEKQPLDENSNEFDELKYLMSQHIRKSGAIPFQKNE